MMEYKYHPIYKYVVFFILTYMYLRYENLMKHDVLLLTSVIITVFAMIIDHMFIHNHLTIIQPLSDQYFDSTDMKIIEKQLDKEMKKEEKLIEKIKEKSSDKKKDKKDKTDKKDKSDKKEKKDKTYKKEKINLEEEDIYNEELYNNYPEEYNEQQENPYYEEDTFYQPQNRPDRLRARTPSKHYAFSEPQIDQMDNILAYNA